MFVIHKNTKQTILGFCCLAICLSAGGLLLPSRALAASKIYAISCVGGNVQTHGSSLSCSNPPALAKVEGIGGAQRPYPVNSGLAVITVNCGSSYPLDPSVGSRASFKCHNGSAPKIGGLKQVQSAPKAASPSKSKPASQPASASPPASSCSQASCDLIQLYIDPAINLLSAAFGLIAVISIILGAIQFITSEGDPQKASKAKNRISNTILAIFAYFVLYGFLQFLIPGGIFNN